MSEPGLDFAALLPHVQVFGGVRRFLELGNVLVQRGHRFVLYHPDGARPDWFPFAGDVRPLAELEGRQHMVLLTASPSLIEPFARSAARLKLFYCVHKNLPGHEIARNPSWTLLANSSALQRRLWRRYRARAEDAIGGVNLDTFRPAAIPRTHEPPIRILVYGRLVRPGKGSLLAVRAVESFAAASRRRWPAWAGSVAHPVKLVLFDHAVQGDIADPRAQFDSTVPYEFHWNLPQDELSRLYASCDIFVAAERRAGWSNTVAEAMACGVPVVCTSAGTQDLAMHGVTALVVRWRHPYMFRCALQTLWRDPARRQQLRRNALTRVREFAWERVADKIEIIARTRLGHDAQPAATRLADFVPKR